MKTQTKRKAKLEPMDRSVSKTFEAAVRENAENRKYYHARERTLLGKYRNQYVAIAEQRVIDADADRDLLLERMFKKLGKKPFFYARVTEHPRILRIRSHSMLRKPIER